jgi:hypothetical protein
MISMSLKVVIIVALVLCSSVASGVVASTQVNQTNDIRIGSISSPSEIVVTSISPTSGKSGEIVPFNLTGSGFASGIRVYLEGYGDKSGKIISAQVITVISPTQLNGTFNLPKKINTGNWQIITKKDSQVTNSSLNFTVTS